MIVRNPHRSAMMTTWRERVLSLFGVAGILINELFARRPPPPPPPMPPHLLKEAWRDTVNLDAAMPTLNDFPMGWKAEGPGFNETFGEDPDYKFAFRVLELNAPTSAGHQWVAVWSGANPYEFSKGWWPTRTRDEAYDQLAQNEQKVAEL